MAENIMNASQRNKLPPKYEPYWRKIGAGHLGFRKRETDLIGAWVAKWKTGEMLPKSNRCKSIQKVLGSLEAIPEYKEAQTQALAWFDQCKGGVVRSGTVEDACKEYILNQRSEKGKASAGYSEQRFEQTVNDTPFGRIKLDALATREIEKWRDSLVTEKRQKKSVNRILRTLKAALNFAFHRAMCPSDAAWRRVKPLKGDGATDEQRTAHLVQAQRQALLTQCDTDLGNFLRGLLYSSARPNELQDAKRRDFDPKQGTIKLSSNKGNGTKRERFVPLSKPAIEFFKEMSKSKLPDAQLMTMSGERWMRHVWARDINTAIDAANKKIEKDAADPKEANEAKLPEDTVAYTMRHCAITDMLLAGINITAVAKMSGTSVSMIEKNYFKFIATDVEDKLGQITAF